MAKILGLVSRGNTHEHWDNCNPYNENDIKKIKDPSGATSKKQITSIPSPFARIDLFKSAFKAMVEASQGKPANLEGETMHHRLVSDCLDMLQMFFNLDNLLEDPNKDIRVITWNQQESLDNLYNSPSPGHHILADTLKLFWEQDAKAYNFDLCSNIFLIEYNGKIIGGTSPATLCFTAANDISFVDVTIGGDSFFDYKFAPLHKRDKEFQKYVHFLFKLHPELKTNMPEVADYVALCFQALAREDRALSRELTNELRKLTPQSFRKNYKPLDTGKFNQTIEVLGTQLYKRHVDISTVAEDSDFLIHSSKLSRDTQTPLVLQNNFSRRNFKYVFGGNWVPNTIVPYTYPEGPINQRRLPSQNLKYPFLTVDDFLEPFLIKLIYPISDKFFDGNMAGFASESDGYLTPIKMRYFEYFDIQDLKGRTPYGDKIFELSEYSSTSVEAILRIPIKGGDDYITFSRVYHMDRPPKVSETDNEGAIIERQFGAAVFPFIKITGAAKNIYRVALIDRDIRDSTKHLSYNLEFFNQQNPTKAIVGQGDSFKERSDKYQDDVSSKYYIVEDQFDVIEVHNGIAKGLLIPLFPQKIMGTQKFAFSVDFGTTTSHVEFNVDNEPRSKAFEITQKDIQFATTYPSGDFTINRAPEIEAILLREFIPEIIGKTYKFPIRTAISEKQGLNHLQSVHVLADLNIPFYYEKQLPRPNAVIHKEIKWSNYSDTASLNRIEKFLENLLYMMRNKVLLNGGDISKTTLAWFYPASMTPSQLSPLRKLWKEQFTHYFSSNEMDAKSATGRIKRMSESLAPFYYYKGYDRVDAGAYPVVSIDIGGGTTDVVVYEDNKPDFITSFKFAGNAIFGDGYNSSPRFNGFVKRYKPEIQKILQSNNFTDLNNVLERLHQESSAETVSFFFSLGGHPDVKKANIKLSFADFLAKDQDLKIVFLTFYGAIFYHIARMMKSKGMGMPRFICLSGNGSRSIGFVDGTEEFEFMTRFAKIMFEHIYNEKDKEPVEPVEGEEQEPKRKYYYGKGVEPDDLTIKQSANPKEVTCKGGLAHTGSVGGHELQLALLGTGDERIIDDKHEKLQYRDLTIDHEQKVIEEVEHFVDTLFALHNEFDFNKYFGIQIPKMKTYKKLLTTDLRQYLKQGLNAKIETDLDGNKATNIEESLFFYPIVGALNILASKAVD